MYIDTYRQPRIVRLSVKLKFTLSHSVRCLLANNCLALDEFLLEAHGIEQTLIITIVLTAGCMYMVRMKFLSNKQTKEERNKD
jgi:branched-subunit amino acid transport protein AzlD